jgi:Cu(I)/Ag(I) efflux system membrane fusion protein
MHLELVAPDRGAFSETAKQAPLEKQDGPLVKGSITPGSTPPGTTPVTLKLDRVQAIGVRTAVVEETDASQKLRATAIVEPAEQGAAEVHVRSPGFVEKIMVNQTGVQVSAGQPLFALYSPEIFQAQSELVAAATWAAPGGGSSGSSSATMDSARRKLALLGMSERDIERVATSKQPQRAIVIEAPQSGYVIKKSVVLGSYVVPETTLYEIQDLSHVYVVADVFQQDIGYLHKGTVGAFTPTTRTAALQGRVDLIYPTLNAEARTTRVRLVLASPKDAPLRPGEYGVVEFATPERRLLSVPKDAVVDTGLSTYVFTVEGEGRFSPKEVVLGPEHGQSVTILAGVRAGERVVSGATFLIDSESRLQASAAQGAAGAAEMASAAPAEMASAPPPPRERGRPVPGEGPACATDFDRAKYPDKWMECQKCSQVHRGMGSMEADCKNAIPRPWK